MNIVYEKYYLALLFLYSKCFFYQQKQNIFNKRISFSSYSLLFLKIIILNCYVFLSVNVYVKIYVRFIVNVADNDIVFV